MSAREAIPSVLRPGPARPSAARPGPPARPWSKQAWKGKPPSTLELKTLRKRLADGRGLPAYLVFSDATLQQMAQFRPATEAEFLALSGVGPKKLQRYGQAFLDLLREHP
jgi:ATP-dependent DNA helicase RecQ